MSTTLAGPPAACCFTGVKHTGTPVGRVESLGGFDTYIVDPPTGSSTTGSNKRVILFLADVWGPLFINNKLLQDYFASCGALFTGDAVRIYSAPNHDHDRDAWIQSSRATALEIFPRWFEAVKSKYGTDTKYCAVGYCFGASFAVDLAVEGSVVAAAVAHPAFLEESHFENLQRPLLLSCPEDDFTFPHAARRRAEDIMVRRKSAYYFQVFSGVKHGFAVRGDPNVPHERWAKEESARGIKEWFIRYTA